MSKIKLMVDSGSDIPKDFVEANDISVIPFHIIFENQHQYLDYYELTSKAFFDKLRECGHCLPKTAQPNPATFLEYFESCEGKYDEIICIIMSSNGSGTYNSGCMAAKEYNDNPSHQTKVHMFDTHQASLGIAFFVYQAVDMLKNNLSTPEILQKLQEIRPRVASYFIPESMDYLLKGGRVNTVTSLIGGILNIRPIITVLEGWGRNYGKVRGFRQISQKFLEMYEEQHASFDLFICHGDCMERASELMDSFKKQFEGIKITLSELGSTMGTHLGPGSLGISFERKDIHGLVEKKLFKLPGMSS